MKRQEPDPQRWADRNNGTSVEDLVGAAIRNMGEPDAPDDSALARIQQMVVMPRRRPQGIGRLAVVTGIALLLVGGVVSAQRGTFPFQRDRVSTIGELSVPHGSTVRIRGKRHRKIALVGPVEVTVGNGDGNTDSIALQGGLVVIEAGDQPLAVSVNGLSVTVPAGSSGAVSSSVEGQPEAIAITGTMEVASASGKTTVGERQLWRRGVTGAATPELLDGVGRALNDTAPVAAPMRTPVLTPAPAPAPAPTPAPTPTPAPNLKPVGAVSAPTAAPTRTPPFPSVPKAKRAAPKPVTLAIAPRPSPQAFAPAPPEPAPPEPAPPERPTSESSPIEPPPPAMKHAPPPFPAPALPARRAMPLPPLAAPVPNPGSPPDRELALIAAAVRRLRADQDPRGALAILDEHGAQFPAGTLGREATLARVETLLALDRRGEALRVLDAAAIRDLPRARAVRATRGELRAELGRCADAVKDFAFLLSSNQRDEYAERALYGRAACHAHSGDATRLRADLTLYQALYPNGRFAAEVRRVLAGP